MHFFVQFDFTLAKKHPIFIFFLHLKPLSIFVNSVYVYDDEKISMIFNVGDNNITVDNSVISDMDNTSLGLYSARFGAPKAE